MAPNFRGRVTFTGYFSSRHDSAVVAIVPHIQMGQFYTNFTLRGPSQQEVASALSGRSAIVTPSLNGCVVAYDEASEAQDFGIISELGARLSRQLGCPVLAAVVHDDDILFFEHYEGGEVTDTYDSAPGYFDADAEPSAPEGGDARRLCAAFGSSNISEVSSILRKSTWDDDGPLATDRHEQLVAALGLARWAVGAGFNYFAAGEMPEGLSEAQLLRTR
jgi:hypothetical protein